MFSDPDLSGVGNPSLLSITDPLASGVDCFAGFDFYKDNHLPFADNQVNFTNFARPVGFKNLEPLFGKMPLRRRFSALSDEVIDLCMPGFH